MKSVIILSCLLLAMSFGSGAALGASGKCTVVKVDGTRMVIECNEKTKGFSKGNKIKIKTDRKIERKK